jgi:23S rRNA pseudouridine2605 synthase
VRLNRFLAAAGVASRRDADTLIAAGRVTVNGRVCTDFHFQPAPEDYVKVEGKRIQPRDHIYLALHKPVGFVCTRNDPHVSDTVLDLLPPKFSSLFYVGRLDASSEGLLLLTNDGEFAQRLTHPRFKLEKEYEATLDRAATPDLGPRLRRGMTLDGKRATITHVRQLSPTRLRLVLEQGINRQIRRMLERLGFRARHLRRVRIGSIQLNDLPRGKWRKLTAAEIRSLSA